MTNETTKRIAKTALMIALIFVCTFTIKLPNPATGGYTHMGRLYGISCGASFR